MSHPGADPTPRPNDPRPLQPPMSAPMPTRAAPLPRPMASPVAPPPIPRRSIMLRPSTLLLLLLIIMFLAPWVGEQIAYHMARGESRAKAEVARELLRELPDLEQVSIENSDAAKARELLVELPQPVNRFSWIVQAVAPSVVGIETVVDSGPINDEREFLWPMPREEGQGSGVIIDDEGRILTNFHVIQNARVIHVRLDDGRLLEDAKIIGVDETTDLAVLQVDDEGLLPIEWGDSDALLVGDSVLAVGSPYGLSETVTSGIISARDRHATVRNGPSYQEFLQTDAAINPGNSGGPLVNLRGELIGINTAIVGDAFQGIGFAIPSKVVRDVADQLIKNRRVSHGWLGVQMAPVALRTAEELGLPNAEGALVLKLVPNSPAVDAGFHRNDVIVSWDGVPIDGPTALSHAVIRTPPGETVDVEIYRNGELRTLQVEVGVRPVML